MCLCVYIINRPRMVNKCQRYDKRNYTMNIINGTVTLY